MAQVLSGLVSPQGVVICDASDPEIPVDSSAANEQLMLTSAEFSHPALMRHTQQGGRSVTVVDGTIVSHRSDTATPVIALNELTEEHRESLSTAVLPAIAAGIAMNIPIECIRSSLVSSSEPGISL